ncbi:MULTISPECIES: hypothetical protein [Mycobacterium]|uniref:Uncharacterized protein n=2 Tax=Mycobacterium TaxID=1763 RepID=A0AA37Q8K5_9MYCO|nr:MULTISPECIES: hypothetical protein [Mycobacterium]APA78390.2 hypothetical protein KV38_24385 [Mycobacterium avium subsp. hominissuis]GLB85734.1 hypothetical protein SRL2020028_49900 [Mycobacterium kiyosense]
MTATALQRPPAQDRPEKVWERLAPLLAAPGRRTVRVYDPATGKFSDSARLTNHLPSRPVAVHLYTRAGRTHVLGLDFDIKRGDADAVDADLATAAEWITRCGGVVVTDRSPGGRHLWCPLAIGTTAGATEISHLVRLLAARLPTLDITPNTNSTSGCLSAPGTVGKTGGYRQLDGPLSVAIDAFTTRSEPSLLPRLYELLGALAPQPASGTDVAAADLPQPPDVDAYCVDEGPRRRLAPAYVRDDPMHPDITAYAQHGTMATGQRQWDSPSEARMAVITAAIARGHSQASISALVAPGGTWHHGLGAAYTRYKHAAGSALERDFHRALTWLCTNSLQHRRPQHKGKYSQGGNYPTGPRGPAELRRWLAAALAWADAEFKGKRARWTVHAVLQALAWNAHQAGHQINGVWVVGVGGRNLSLATGLLSEDAVWRVLRDIRDKPGAPLILTRPAVGTEADFYALTTPAAITVSDTAIERVRVEPVHDAWSVIGHHLRRVYELVAYHGVTDRADLYAAAAVSASTGDEAVTALQIAGLLVKTGRGTVAAGTTTLADLATAHDTATIREDRIAKFRDERAQWRTYLDERDQAHEDALMEAIARAMPAEDPDADRTFWAAARAHGPPADSDMDTERRAIDLVADLLGARIVATAS